MFIVTFTNAGGSEEKRTAETEDDAAQVAIKLIREIGSLMDGDKITIREEDQ